MIIKPPRAVLEKGVVLVKKETMCSVTKESETGKMTDETFMKLITMGILSIVIYLAGLVVTTWLWYTATLTIADTHVSASSFTDASRDDFTTAAIESCLGYCVT